MELPRLIYIYWLIHFNIGKSDGKFKSTNSKEKQWVDVALEWWKIFLVNEVCALLKT